MTYHSGPITLVKDQWRRRNGGMREVKSIRKLTVKAKGGRGERRKQQAEFRSQQSATKTNGDKRTPPPPPPPTKKNPANPKRLDAREAADCTVPEGRLLYKSDVYHLNGIFCQNCPINGIGLKKHGRQITCFIKKQWFHDISIIPINTDVNKGIRLKVFLFLNKFQ